MLHKLEEFFSEINFLENSCDFFDRYGARAPQFFDNAVHPQRPFPDSRGKGLDVDIFFEGAHKIGFDRKACQINQEGVAAVPIVIKSSEELELMDIVGGYNPGLFPP